jgi:SAM-dependent methyltransferase
VTADASTARCLVCGDEVAVPHAVRFRKNGFEIARCPSCGLLFRLSLPTEEELAQIYDSSYFSSTNGAASGEGFQDYLADADQHQDAARRRLERLERFISRGRLLDVGAAAGFFVAEAAARDWDARGIDIAGEMVQWGRNHLAAALERKTIHALDVEVGSLDAVTMWDYIEHTLDPPADLERARELLRPGGVVAISTGDAASLAAKLSGSRWHLLTPRHHNYFFTAASLRRLLTRLGFEVLYEGHPGARYSLRYLSYKLRTLIDVTPVRRVGDLLARSKVGNIAVPVNLGDIVTVVARR